MRSNSYPRTSFCGHANNNCGAAADVHGLYLSPARSELRRSRLAATLVTTAGISPQNARKSGGSGERWRPRVPQIPQLCLQTRSFLQRSRLAPAAAAVATSKAALAVAAHAKANQTICSSSAVLLLSSCAQMAVASTPAGILLLVTIANVAQLSEGACAKVLAADGSYTVQGTSVDVVRATAASSPLCLSRTSQTRIGSTCGVSNGSAVLVPHVRAARI